MKQVDVDYSIGREKTETALAHAALNQAVSGIHRELAARYAHLVRRAALVDHLDDDDRDPADLAPCFPGLPAVLKPASPPTVLAGGSLQVLADDGR